MKKESSWKKYLKNQGIPRLVFLTIVALIATGTFLSFWLAIALLLVIVSVMAIAIKKQS